MADEEQGGSYDSYAGLLQNIEWLKTSNARLGRALAFSLFAIVVLVLLAAAGWLSRPKREVVAVTPDFRVIQLVPLDQPVLTEDGVRAFAARVTTECLSLHFTSWQDQLAGCKHYFTPDTFSALEDVLQTSGIINSIKNQRLDANVTLNGPAVVESHWVADGVLYVDVLVPITMSYEATDGTHGQQVLQMEVTVRRVPEDAVAAGVVVSSFINKPAAS